MLDSGLPNRTVPILVDPANSTQNVYLWANASKRCKDATSGHFMLSSLKQRTAFPRRPAKSRRQASRFTMLIGPWLPSWLALCGEAVLQLDTTTVAESGCCRQVALSAIALSRPAGLFKDRCGDLGPWANMGAARTPCGISTLEAALL